MRDAVRRRANANDNDTLMPPHLRIESCDRHERSKSELITVFYTPLESLLKQIFQNQYYSIDCAQKMRENTS